MRNSPQDWERVKALFEGALQCEPALRSTFLQEQTPEQDVRDEVMRLLAEHDAAGDFLSSPPLAQPQPVRHAADQVKPNEVLAGRFRITRFIAAGGMGEVYEAEDTELRERLAIKTIKPELLNRPDALSRFKTEVHLARKVTHANVCRVYDIFRHSDKTQEIVFVSMELLHGQTLAEHLKSRGRMSVTQALPLIIQMADALTAAHDVGVVHRDFKPGNVLLVPSGEEDKFRVVVTDFGLALRSAHSDSVSVSMGAPGLFGTPAYMAPEQLEGQQATSATDIYALGLVIYEMVVGVRPFESDSAISSALKRLNEPPVPPRKLEPNISPECESVILRCLEREPSKRFGSAREAVLAMVGARVSPFARWRKLRWPLSIVIGLLLIFAAYRFHLAIHNQTIVPRRSVAVLEFKDLTGESQWLATALPEWVATELAAGNNLRVISGEDVARMTRDLALKNAESYSLDTLDRIHKILGADYVVVGSYFDPGGQPGQNVRLDLRLQDTATGQVLNSLTDTATIADMPSVAARTGLRLRRTLGAGDIPNAEIKATQASLPLNPEAAKLYAQGLGELRRSNPIVARDLLQQAVGFEPGFPWAHSELASAWSSLGYQEKSKKEAKLAFDLSGDLPPRERLYIEARYRQENNEAAKAVELYHSLWTLYPDNLAYGLRLATVQEIAGSPKDALATLDTIRRTLPAQADDPQIDLADAHASGVVADYRRKKMSSARAVAKGEALGERSLVARALLSEGDALGELGQPDQALDRFTRAKQIATDLGDLGQVSVALNDMGMNYQARGKVDEANKLFEESLRIERQIGFLGNTAWTLNEMAITLRHSGKPELAKEKMEQALAIRRETNDKNGMAVALGNIANLLDDSGDIEGAKLKYQESLALQREIGNRRGQAISLGNIGNILYEQGHLPESQQYFADSIAIGHQINSKPYLVWALGSFAQTQLSQADFEGARKSQEEAIGYAKALGMKSDLATLQALEAVLSTEEGHPYEAEKLLANAIAEFQEEKDTDSEAQSRAWLAEAFLRQGRLDDAMKELNLATQAAAKSRNAHTHLSIFEASARALTAANQYAQAKQKIDAGLAIAGKPGNVPYEFDLRLSRCELEQKMGTSLATSCLINLKRQAAKVGFQLVAQKAGAQIH
jgi:tetratricopeptide (TPR) repeat protein/tRNA A-37 threonylcarbamoyl transferase component Bud32